MKTIRAFLVWLVNLFIPPRKRTPIGKFEDPTPVVPKKRKLRHAMNNSGKRWASTKGYSMQSSN